MTTFWNLALSLMKEKHLNQTDIAKVTGKNKSTVSDWIKNDAYPKVDDAFKISEYLGVSVRYLITGKDKEQFSPRIRELLAMGISDAEAGWLCDQLVSVRMLEHRKKGEISPASDTVAG